MKKTCVIFCLSVLVLLSSCLFFQNDPEVRIDPELAASLRDQARDTIAISPYSYVLEGYLWRDFMPGPAESESGLIAMNQLINLSGDSIPSGLEILEQWVIKGDTIWFADYSDETMPVYSDRLERISRKGPEWKPGTFVDVVVQVMDFMGGEAYKIKRTGIQIFATY